MGFKSLKSEQCIFVRSNIILCIYVDDIAIIAPTTSDVDSFIKELEQHIRIKNLGPIKDYLGVDIDYDLQKGTLKMSLKKYINKAFNKFKILDYKDVATPMDPKTKMEPNKEQVLKDTITEY